MNRGWNGESRVDQTLDSWFAEGPTELPDRTIAAIVDGIGHVKQQGTTAFPGMGQIGRFAMLVSGAAVVLLVAVVALSFTFGQRGGIGGPGPVDTLATPSEAPTLSPTESPTPSPIESPTSTPTAPPTPSPSPSPTPVPRTVFEGTWTSIDPADGSDQFLVVASGKTPNVHFVDQFATGAACVGDAVKVFTADGIGSIKNDALRVTWPDGGGCGLMTVEVPKGTYTFNPAGNTLVDGSDLVWSRVGDDVVPPTRAPLATETPLPSGSAAPSEK